MNAFLRVVRETRQGQATADADGERAGADEHPAHGDRRQDFQWRLDGCGQASTCGWPK